MRLIKRQLSSYIFDPELSSDKMVFVSGPRQVGKTTYAKQLLGTHDEKLTYYNWDNPLVRKNYRNDPFFFLDPAAKSNSNIVVFDEIHKRKEWKNILKGLYDTVEKDIRFLVTGSARLDMFRKSGDSLVGRYVLFHMFPLSLAEVMETPLDDLWLTSKRDWQKPWASLKEKLHVSPRSRQRAGLLEDLLKFSGFPEPLFKGSDRALRRWKDEYITLILKEDLRDLTNIKAIETMEHILSLLPERIGSLLSINAIAKDVGVSHPTVKNHLMQLKKLWLLFELRPWSRRINRSLKKGKKWYFSNWIYADGDAAIFENFVASSLMRASTIWSELAYGTASLFYVRNFDGSEVDFLLLLNNKPGLLIEAKLNDTSVSRPLRFFGDMLNIPKIQVVRKSGVYKIEDENTVVVSADRLLSVFP